MNASANVVVDRPNVRVRVIRFLRPDLRSALYDAEPITEGTLYQEIRNAAGLADLAACDVVVLNLGLVEWLPSIFYRVLMELRAEITRHRARLYLCGLQPGVKEVFDLMGGSRLFEIRPSEHRAVIDGIAQWPFARL